VTDTISDNVPQRDKVICDEEYQIAFWTDHFGISKEVLLEVVRKVGPKVGDVTAELVIHRPAQ
jgi:hypothetical protein